MPPLTAAEIVQHPEFEHVTWDLPPTKKGKVAVAKGRGGPLDIAYEVHGHGPIHLLVRAYFDLILRASCFAGSYLIFCCYLPGLFEPGRESTGNGISLLYLC